MNLSFSNNRTPSEPSAWTGHLSLPPVGAEDPDRAKPGPATLPPETEPVAPPAPTRQPAPNRPAPGPETNPGEAPCIEPGPCRFERRAPAEVA